MATQKEEATKTAHAGEKQTSDRISLTIRMGKDLHSRVNEHCEALGLSANSYVITLIEQDLRSRSRSR